MHSAASGNGVVTIQEYKTFLWGGVFWVVFALILRFVVIPWQIADELPQSGTHARYIPEAVSYLLMLGGVLLAMNGYKIRNVPGQRMYVFNLGNMRLVGYSLIVISANIVAFNLIGYIIPAICTLAILMLLYGNRSYVKIAIISIALPLLINQLFKVALQLYLP